MERVRTVANYCVGRTVVVGWLLIGAAMFVWSSEPEAAFRLGATLGLALSAFLVLRASAMDAVEPARTPVWIYLDDASRPRDEADKAAMSSVLRNVYAQYAGGVLLLACVFFASSAALAELDALTAPMPDVAAFAG